MDVPLAQFASPLAGEVDRAVGRGVMFNAIRFSELLASLTLPRRKSGSPDLRINHVRNAGEPDLRWEGDASRSRLRCASVVTA